LVDVVVTPLDNEKNSMEVSSLRVRPYRISVVEDVEKGKLDVENEPMEKLTVVDEPTGKLKVEDGPMKVEDEGA
jgi:hypothetical protein